MEDKLKETGEVTFGAGCVRSFPGKGDFDKYYIDTVVKKVVKRTGPGEEDFIIEDKIVETKRDIVKEINAQRGDVGIESYMKYYEMTGEPVPDFKVTDDIQDFTGMPDNLADAVLLGENSRKMFASLPKELVGKMTYDEFISNFTQAQFDAYIASITPKAEEKKEGNE